MSEERENEYQWLEPSNMGETFTIHAEAMRLCAQVPVGKAFAVAPGLNVGILRKIAESYKPKKIVVIDHKENGFEVRRLDNNDDITLFYKLLEKPKIHKEEFSVEHAQKLAVMKAIRAFLESADDEIAKYDAKSPEAKRINCITKAYIQRKVSALACFRAEGANLITNAISVLEDDGILQKLSKVEAQEFLNCKGIVYRINRQNFAEADERS